MEIERLRFELLCTIQFSYYSSTFDWCFGVRCCCCFDHSRALFWVFTSFFALTWCQILVLVVVASDHRASCTWLVLYFKYFCSASVVVEPQLSMSDWLDGIQKTIRHSIQQQKDRESQGRNESRNCWKANSHARNVCFRRIQNHLRSRFWI